MAHDKFDVYATMIKDTNEMNSRRRQLDSLYVTIITLIMTGAAYVAFYSALNNWLLVAVSVGVSVVGIVVTNRWRDGLRNLDKILDHRYEFLRNLEASDELLAIGATLYSDEWNNGFYGLHKDKRARSVTNRLQLTFISVFILIPLALAALTAIDTIPALHSLIPAQILHYIAPIAPGFRP